MRNVDVIRAFLQGNSAKTTNLRTNGIELINYQTRIGYKKDGHLYINKDRYSVTTSKIQGKLKAECSLAGREYEEVTESEIYKL